MKEIKWWHTFGFDDFKTIGLDSTPTKRDFIGFPEEIKGSVLDIGAWDGYFSFLAEKNGASRVLAVDSPKHSWNKEKITVAGEDFKMNGKEGFETARKILNSKVEDREMEIVDITKENVGTFDTVLCLGILYHMKDPFQIIRNLAEVTNKKLIIETHMDGNYLSAPAMMFYPTNELNNDDGNWWGPNLLCLVKMLEVSGFKKIEVNPSGARVAIHAEK